jgi:hypothetical protein
VTTRADRVLEAALDEAEAAPGGWYDLRLHRVANRAGLSLPEILADYRDADAIADAWFARAQRAMLEVPPEALDGLPPAARAEAVLLRWFQAQAPRRRVVGTMVRAKLHASHFHHWVPAVFHVSRLMHWALDAARCEARGNLARQAEEVGATAAFLAALRAFPRDDDALAATRRRLRRGLAFLDRLPRRG